MLKKFDDLCENILIEGRKSDDKKKFKVNVDKAKQHVNEIGDKHHHYRNDKSHFLTIIDELNPNTVYTPKTFMDNVKSVMKGVGKPAIADGYSKLLYSFLKDRVDSPFEDHNEDQEETKTEKEEVDHEDLLNEPEDTSSEVQNS